MGYLPGYATPRIICDVPMVGKRWVHQLSEYDRELGISYWTKNYRTSIEADDPDALTRRYPFYDPIDTLPKAGQEWWRHMHPPVLAKEAGNAAAAQSRQAVANQDAAAEVA
jgi:lysine 2,3-aminomutase